MIQNNRYDEIPKGILAFSPFYLVVASSFIGLSTGLLAVVIIFSLLPILYLLRKLISPSQRLSFIIIVSVSWMLIARMLLDAEAYFLADKLGLLLPLLLMNSLVLSINESILSMSNLKSVMSCSYKICIAILLFFVLFGFLRELLNDVSIISSPAGFFILSGFLIAIFNFFQRKY
jgi:Na+-translocating ferredoxin:NAD+ oxidoreductase RnfE subunit